MSSINTFFQNVCGLLIALFWTSGDFWVSKSSTKMLPVPLVAFYETNMINFNSNVDVNTTANVRCEQTSRLLRFGERKTLTSEPFCSTFQPIVQTDTNWSILPIKFQ